MIAVLICLNLIRHNHLINLQYQEEKDDNKGGERNSMDKIANSKKKKLIKTVEERR